MFVLDVDSELKLALIHPKFVKDYLAIVEQDREYLAQWLPWVSDGYDEAFVLGFI